MNIVFALIIFSIIVIIHELGHFIFAKINGVEVLEFSLGLGPRILKFQGKETLYSIKLFPFGGSCRMLGEDDIKESEDFKEKKDKSFNEKSVYARFMIVFAGPLFNFILAFLVAIVLISNIGVDKPIVSKIKENSSASKVGILENDEILKVNGKKISTTREFMFYRRMNNHIKDFELDILRNENGEKKVLKYKLSLLLDEEDNKEKLGLFFTTENYKTKNIFEILKYSYKELTFNIKSTLIGIKAMFTGLIGLDQVSGPIGILNVVGNTIKKSSSYGFYFLFLSILTLVLVLSANLGVMNLLPIPALDGGRILFYIFEMITGKRANQKVETYIHIAGFLFLISLMIFVVFNDVYRLIK